MTAPAISYCVVTNARKNKFFWTYKLSENNDVDLFEAKDPKRFADERNASSPKGSIRTTMTPKKTTAGNLK